MHATTFRSESAIMTAMQRLLAAAGAVFAALAVALSAYASHGAEGGARASLGIAAAVVFGHGVASAALAPQARGRLARASLLALLLGAAMFGGGVVAGALLGAGGGIAPLGGSLQIGGWLAYAVACLRS
jgi:uncharacterized membrane protein YgdD (TMEM256/DUF423 family)